MPEDVRMQEDQEFFQSFLGDSEELRDDGHTQDEKIEALENYLVIPPPQTPGQNTPLSLRAALKDPESHQVVETWIAKLMLMNLGHQGFVDAVPGGGSEDAFGANVVSKLIQSGFRRPGNYRSMYVGYKDAAIFGQTVILPSWVYWEGPMTRIDVTEDMFTGDEIVERREITVPRQNDVMFLPIDVDDFFPYPGEDNIENMLFAAHRYVIPRHRVMEHVEQGRWDRGQVELAIGGANPDVSRGRGWDSTESEDKSWRWSMDRTVHDRMSELYKPLVAVEGWGEVPYKPKDGARLRRLTLLNGVIVESRPAPITMPRRIPYCDMVMNPIKGRWRGISPIVINRYTQSFADALLICLADATIKMTNAPVLVDQNAQIDMSQLEAWTGPIRTQDIAGVRELEYKPQLGAAFQMYMGLKEQEQQASGMHGGLQGQGLGSKRFSASEAVETFKQALDRPNMMAQLFENEYLPALGRMVFELYQQFLPNSQELARRVGQSTMRSNRNPSLADIDGSYDLQFVGSTRMQSKEVQLQFLERSFQVIGSVPGAAPLYPWTEAILKWLELADLRDIEAKVGDKDGVEDFIERTKDMQTGQPDAGGNGTASNAALPQLNLGPSPGMGI